MVKMTLIGRLHLAGGELQMNCKYLMGYAMLWTSLSTAILVTRMSLERTL